MSVPALNVLQFFGLLVRRKETGMRAQITIVATREMESDSSALNENPFFVLSNKMLPILHNFDMEEDIVSRGTPKKINIDQANPIGQLPLQEFHTR